MRTVIGLFLSRPAPRRVVACVLIALVVAACDRGATTVPQSISPTTGPTGPTTGPTETFTPVPDVEGNTLLEARQILKDAGLDVAIEWQYSHKSPRTVLHQAPAEETLESVVVLVLAQPFPRIPGVVGLPIAKARDELRSAEFPWTVREVYSDEVPEGTVIEQTPAARTEARPSRSVRLVVSLGPDCVEGYSVCLSHRYDYDCAGGSGEPPWAYGPIRVTGYDPYGLDGDNDGWGCE